MGRTAAGVRGIRLPDGEDVISLIIPDADGLILTASENGYGKLTPVDEFPVHGRGGQGVIAHADHRAQRRAWSRATAGAPRPTSSC